MKRTIAATLDAEFKPSFSANFKRRFIKHTPVVSSFLLAALFLYAAYNKLAIYNSFIKQLKKSPSIQDLPKLINFFGVTFSSIALLLILNSRTRRIGLWSTFALMLAYTTHNYVVVPLSYPVFLAWFIPGIEIVIAATLLIPRTRHLGLWLGFILMILFTAYIYVTLFFFRQPTCNCGGIISQLNWQGHFFFNLGFTLLAGLGVSARDFQKKFESNS